MKRNFSRSYCTPEYITFEQFTYFLWTKIVENIVIVSNLKFRSLGQGNIFRSVCQEFCPQGRCLVPGGAWSQGVPGPEGGHFGGFLVPGVPSLGGAWSGGFCPGGCLVLVGCLLRGVHAPGVCLLQGVPGGGPPDGHCCRRYTSYWILVEYRFRIWTKET